MRNMARDARSNRRIRRMLPSATLAPHEVRACAHAFMRSCVILLLGLACSLTSSSVLCELTMNACSCSFLQIAPIFFHLVNAVECLKPENRAKYLSDAGLKNVLADSIVYHVVSGCMLARVFAHSPAVLCEQTVNPNEGKAVSVLTQQGQAILALVNELLALRLPEREWLVPVA